MNEHNTWFWHMLDWLTEHYPIIAGLTLGVFTPVIWAFKRNHEIKENIHILSISVKNSEERNAHLDTAITELRREVKETNRRMSEGHVSNEKQHSTILETVGKEIGDLKSTIIGLLGK